MGEGISVNHLAFDDLVDAVMAVSCQFITSPVLCLDRFEEVYLGGYARGSEDGEDGSQEMHLIDVQHFSVHRMTALIRIEKGDGLYPAFGVDGALHQPAVKLAHAAIGGGAFGEQHDIVLLFEGVAHDGIRPG